MFDTVKRTSENVHNSRTLQDVFCSIISEIGELSDELMIEDGFRCDRTPGDDGVVGEAMDTIICLLDLIHVYDPTITEKDLQKIAAAKCNKWYVGAMEVVKKRAQAKNNTVPKA